MGDVADGSLPVAVGLQVDMVTTISFVARKCGSPTAQIRFDDVRVLHRYRIGEEGSGFTDQTHRQ